MLVNDTNIGPMIYGQSFKPWLAEILTFGEFPLSNLEDITDLTRYGYIPNHLQSYFFGD